MRTHPAARLVITIPFLLALFVPSVIPRYLRTAGRHPSSGNSLLTSLLSCFRSAPPQPGVTTTQFHSSPNSHTPTKLSLRHITSKYFSPHAYNRQNYRYSAANDKLESIALRPLAESPAESDVFFATVFPKSSSPSSNVASVSADSTSVSFAPTPNQHTFTPASMASSSSSTKSLSPLPLDPSDGRITSAPSTSRGVVFTSDPTASVSISIPFPSASGSILRQTISSTLTFSVDPTDSLRLTSPSHSMTPSMYLSSSETHATYSAYLFSPSSQFYRSFGPSPLLASPSISFMSSWPEISFSSTMQFSPLVTVLLSASFTAVPASESSLYFSPSLLSSTAMSPSISPRAFLTSESGVVLPDVSIKFSPSLDIDESPSPSSSHFLFSVSPSGRRGFSLPPTSEPSRPVLSYSQPEISVIPSSSDFGSDSPNAVIFSSTVSPNDPSVIESSEIPQSPSDFILDQSPSGTITTPHPQISTLAQTSSLAASSLAVTDIMSSPETSEVLPSRSVEWDLFISPTALFSITSPEIMPPDISVETDELKPSFIVLPSTSISQLPSTESLPSTKASSSITASPTLLTPTLPLGSSATVLPSPTSTATAQSTVIASTPTSGFQVSASPDFTDENDLGTSTLGPSTFYTPYPSTSVDILISEFPPVASESIGTDEVEFGSSTPEPDISYNPSASVDVVISDFPPAASESVENTVGVTTEYPSASPSNQATFPLPSNPLSNSVSTSQQLMPEISSTRSPLSPSETLQLFPSSTMPPPLPDDNLPLESATDALFPTSEEISPATSSQDVSMDPVMSPSITGNTIIPTLMGEPSPLASILGLAPVLSGEEVIPSPLASASVTSSFYGSKASSSFESPLAIVPSLTSTFPDLSFSQYRTDLPDSITPSTLMVSSPSFTIDSSSDLSVSLSPSPALSYDSFVPTDSIVASIPTIVGSPGITNDFVPFISSNLASPEFGEPSSLPSELSNESVFESPNGALFSSDSESPERSVGGLWENVDPSGAVDTSLFSYSPQISTDVWSTPQVSVSRGSQLTYSPSVFVSSSQVLSTPSIPLPIPDPTLESNFPTPVDSHPTFMPSPSMFPSTATSASVSHALFSPVPSPTITPSVSFPSYSYIGDPLPSSGMSPESSVVQDADPTLDPSVLLSVAVEPSPFARVSEELLSPVASPGLTSVIQMNTLEIFPSDAEATKPAFSSMPFDSIRPSESPSNLPVGIVSFTPGETGKETIHLYPTSNVYGPNESTELETDHVSSSPSYYETASSPYFISTTPFSEPGSSFAPPAPSLIFEPAPSVPISPSVGSIAGNSDPSVSLDSDLLTPAIYPSSYIEDGWNSMEPNREPSSGSSSPSFEVDSVPSYPFSSDSFSPSIDALFPDPSPSFEVDSLPSYPYSSDYFSPSIDALFPDPSTEIESPTFSAIVSNSAYSDFGFTPMISSTILLAESESSLPTPPVDDLPVSSLSSVDETDGPVQSWEGAFETSNAQETLGSIPDIYSVSPSADLYSPGQPTYIDESEPFNPEKIEAPSSSVDAIETSELYSVVPSAAPSLPPEVDPSFAFSPSVILPSDDDESMLQSFTPYALSPSASDNILYSPDVSVTIFKEVETTSPDWSMMSTESLGVLESMSQILAAPATAMPYTPDTSFGDQTESPVFSDSNNVETGALTITPLPSLPFENTPGLLSWTEAQSGSPNPDFSDEITGYTIAPSLPIVAESNEFSPAPSSSKLDETPAISSFVTSTSEIDNELASSESQLASITAEDLLPSSIMTSTFSRNPSVSSTSSPDGVMNPTTFPSSSEPTVEWVDAVSPSPSYSLIISGSITPSTFVISPVLPSKHPSVTNGGDGSQEKRSPSPVGGILGDPVGNPPPSGNGLPGGVGGTSVIAIASVFVVLLIAAVLYKTCAVMPSIGSGFSISSIFGGSDDSNGKDGPESDIMSGGCSGDDSPWDQAWKNAAELPEGAQREGEAAAALIGGKFAGLLKPGGARVRPPQVITRLAIPGMCMALSQLSPESGSSVMSVTTGFSSGPFSLPVSTLEEDTSMGGSSHIEETRLGLNVDILGNIEAPKVDLLFVLDASGSMSWRDYRHVKEFITKPRGMLEEVMRRAHEGSRVGAVEYAYDSVVVSELDRDYDLVRRRLLSAFQGDANNWDHDGMYIYEVGDDVGGNALRKVDSLVERGDEEESEITIRNNGNEEGPPTVQAREVPPAMNGMSREVHLAMKWSRFEMLPPVANRRIQAQLQQTMRLRRVVVVNGGEMTKGGHSNGGIEAAIAEKVKMERAGIRVITLGIGNHFEKDLNKLSSRKHHIIVKTVNDLEKMIGRLTEMILKADMKHDGKYALHPPAVLRRKRHREGRNKRQHAMYRAVRTGSIDPVKSISKGLPRRASELPPWFTEGVS